MSKDAQHTPSLTAAVGSVPPPSIPDHELLRRIGGGSYGEVWLARSVMGTYRAVKIVHRHTFEHDRPFEREFAGIQKFEPISRSHEGLVDLLQVGRNDTEDYFYYVMELADAAQPPLEDGRPKREDGGGAPGGGHAPASLLDPQRYAPRTLASEIRSRGRLPLDECIQLGLSLTSALAYLHGQGLVHRDIKPSNIIFVGGVPKLADVGLVTGVDEARSYVGTEGFIPPEGPGTPQADVYSLGILLYQTSTGKSHRDFPEPLPDLAAQPDHNRWLEFNAVVHKACASDPRERYQSAGEMHAELALLQRGESVKRRRTLERRWGFAKRYGLATAAAALVLAGVWLLASRFDVSIHRPEAFSTPAPAPVAIKSIAVLPFDNDSADKGDEYLGGQMAEELSAALAKIPGLRVLGHDSAVRLKGATNLSTAAQQLKLSAVLRGRTRKSDRQLYVSAQLIRPADESLLWSQVYDREPKEIFGIQTDIAEKLAETLKLKLTDTVRANLATSATKNFEAYRCYLEGRGFLSREAVVQALASFQEASRLDTNFALAYAGQSDCYASSFARFRLPSPKDHCSNALALAENAVRLDGRSAEAHTSLAKARYRLYDWEGAEKEFQRAIRLNSNYAQLHGWYAELQRALGQFDKSIEASKLAKELDPWSPLMRRNLGWALFDAGHYDQAQQEFEELRKLEENDRGAWDGLGWCCEVKGKHEEAVASWEQHKRFSGGIPEKIAALAQAYKSGGMRGYWQEELDQMLEQGKYADSYWIAAGYAAIGDKDQAFRWLDRAHDEHQLWMPLVAVEYHFYNLHSDQRFAALLERMRLPSFPLATNAPSQVKSIAVLPFDNESPDKADEYLGAQMAEELSSALTKIPELRVLGRDSAIRLNKSKDRRTTAQQLKLDAVLEGRVRKSGQQLQVTAQLVNTTDDFVLWSETYDRKVADIFGIQTDIAEKIVEKFNLKLTDTLRARLALKPTKNLEAYQLYLEGRHLWTSQPHRAIEIFEAAIRLDTNFAAAYAGLADCYIDDTQERSSGKESFPKALVNATKAVELAPGLAEAHSSLARIKCHYEYDWEGAGKEFELAIRLNPANARAQQWYSKYLDIMGRFVEAIAHARLATELDPLSPSMRNTLAWNFFDARQYEQALEEFRGLLELDEASAIDGIGWCYVAKGRQDEAIPVWEKKDRMWGLSLEKSAESLQAYKQSGMRGYWLKHVEQAKEGANPSNMSPFWIAADYAMLGENDQAFVWLERAYEDRTFYMPWVAVEYRLYGLHSDSRFAPLLEKMRLEMPVWQE